MRTRVASFPVVLVSAVLNTSAGAQPIEYEDESEFLADLASMGFVAHAEDFESGVWVDVRYPDLTLPSVTNDFLTWTGNGHVTTNTNWGRDWTYGVFTIFGPIAPEWFRVESTRTLYAAGGWFDSGGAADMGIVIDGAIVATRPVAGAHQFIGVIDPSGFTSVEFHELEQEAVIGADDFTFGILPQCVADFAEPLGVLDFSDIAAFLTAFGAMSPEADLAAPIGVHDFSDVVAFLAAFGAGCP